MTRDKASSVAARKRSRLAVARALLFFFAFLGLEILIDNHRELEFGATCESAHADDTPWLYEAIYPRLTSLLIRKPPSGRVAIVYIPEELSEVQQNVCRGRIYLAALIGVLRNQNPAAIVLDKYFSTGSCTFDDAEKDTTAALQNAVASARAKNISIITGQSTTPAKYEAEGSCLVEKPGFDLFGRASAYGLTKLNANREQIPVAWLVLNAPPSGSDAVIQSSSPHTLKGLALTAAGIIATGAQDQARLAAVANEPRQPYTRLDTPFSVDVSSLDLVCRSGVDCPTSSATPQAYVGKPNVHLPIAGSTVIVGARSSSDRWLVLGKRYWGYELQAAYLDALLANRYLRAVPGTWIFTLPILFLFLLEAVPVIGDYLHCERHLRIAPLLRRSELWLLVWSPAFLLLTLFACSLRHYLPPLSVLLGIIVTLAVRAVFNAMEYFRKQSTPDRKEAES